MADRLNLYLRGAAASPAWQARRDAILARAGHCCEDCGAEAGTSVWRRAGDGAWIEHGGKVWRHPATGAELEVAELNDRGQPMRRSAVRSERVVITVDPVVGKALCQRCQRRETLNRAEADRLAVRVYHQTLAGEPPLPGIL